MATLTIRIEMDNAAFDPPGKEGEPDRGVLQ
jgi:hypothetical protein